MIRTNVIVEIDFEEVFNNASEELQEKIVNDNIAQINTKTLKDYVTKNFSFYEVSNWFDYGEVSEFIKTYSSERKY